MAEESGARTAPVYVPYATLISSFDTLRAHGIPKSGVIDKSIWDSQSGTVQAQLILAYKFLGLIDDNKSVMATLPPLVSSLPEERKPILKGIIENKYHSVIAHGLTTISPAQFDQAFKDFDITGSTKVRAMRFFIKACTELGIPIGKRFMERSKPTGPRKKRTPAERRNPVEAPAAQTATEAKPPSWEEQLLGKFPAFDPEWPDDLKTKWFAGFERLMGAKPGE